MLSSLKNLRRLICMRYDFLLSKHNLVQKGKSPGTQDCFPFGGNCREQVINTDMKQFGSMIYILYFICSHSIKQINKSLLIADISTLFDICYYQTCFFPTDLDMASCDIFSHLHFSPHNPDRHILVQGHYSFCHVTQHHYHMWLNTHSMYPTLTNLH